MLRPHYSSISTCPNLRKRSDSVEPALDLLSALVLSTNVANDGAGEVFEDVVGGDVDAGED